MSYRRILTVRLDNVGDVVMLTPALRALRAAMPAAEIALLCSPAGSQVAPLLPWVDEVLPARATWQQTGEVTAPPDPGRELALVARLRDGAFDAAFVFTSWAQSPHPPAYVCLLAGIGVRVGESKEFGGHVLSHAAPQLPDDAHQVDRNLHLLGSVGIEGVGTHLELRLPPGTGVPAGAPYAVLAPGASCPSRRYPAERFAEVARRLDLPVVVVGSDREWDPAERIASAARRGRSLAGRTTIPELAAVIAGAAVVVANNSAPMHIAEAFRRPLVALFAGTELESQFAPRHTRMRLLRRPTWCSPCHTFRCPFELECLDLPPAEVVAAVHDVLEGDQACAS